MTGRLASFFGWVLLALAWLGLMPGAMAQRADDLRAGVVKVTSRAEGQQQRTGAGFVVRADSGSAYVVTASHVVEGDPQPRVSFAGAPDRQLPAQVIGLDATDPKGLAVLRVDSGVPASVRVLPIDTSSDYRGGTPAIVIGFPLTHGTGWSVIPSTIDGLRGRDLVLTAPLEAGDSGGPVIVGGKVVGAVVETRGQFGLAVPAAIIQLSLQGWKVFGTAAQAAAPRLAEPSPLPAAPKPQSDAGAGATLRPEVRVETRFHNEPMGVEALALSADGLSLLIGGREFHKTPEGSAFGRPSLTLWDLTSGRLVRSLTPVHRHQRAIDVLDLSRDGRRAIAAGASDFALFDTTTGAVLREYPLGNLLSAEKPLLPHRRKSGCSGGNYKAIALALSRDGRRALSLDDGCMLRLWEVDGGQVIWSSASYGPPKTLAFSPDERLVLTGGSAGDLREPGEAEPSGYPRLWDASNGRLIRSFAADSAKLADTVSLAFSPDGRFAASHSKPKGIVLWNVASGTLLRVLIGQSELGDSRDDYALRFTTDGRYLLAGCLVHDLHAGQTTRMQRGLSFWKPCAGPVVALPGGPYAIYPGEYGFGAQVHDFTTGKMVATLTNLGDGEWMTVTADSHYVASPAGEKRLRVRAGGATLPIDGFRATYARDDEVARALAPLLTRR